MSALLAPIAFDPFEPFAYAFFQRGLVVAVLAGALCGLVGVYVVLRSMSFVGHGLSHAVFGGAAMSAALGASYFLGAGVWGVITAQTGLMGLVAGLLALPVGVLLAAVLVFVINRRSFGWTMPLDVRPDVLLQGLLLAVVAALLAGFYPALRMAGASPAEALRDE